MRKIKDIKTRNKAFFAVGTLMLAALFVITLGSGSSTAGFLAKITNSTDTAGSAQYFKCATAYTADKTNAIFQYSFNQVSNSTTATDLSGHGSSGTYNGNMTADNTTRTSGCPRDAGRVYVLDGTTSYLTNSPGTSHAAIDTFTEEVWFNAASTVTTGGRLIGWGAAATGASGQYDRHIWMDNSGKINFGVYNGAIHVITSPSAYNDGNWHYVAASLSTAGMSLYIDGAVVGTDPTTTGEGEAGYWRIGYDNVNSWGATTPTNYFFNGKMAWAAVYSVVLTAAQLSNHWSAGRSAN